MFAGMLFFHVEVETSPCGEGHPIGSHQRHDRGARKGTGGIGIDTRGAERFIHEEPVVVYYTGLTRLSMHRACDLLTLFRLMFFLGHGRGERVPG